MKIYTKTGDSGQTSLYRGGRVSKDSARVNAYGTVDELNCHVGFVRSLKPDGFIDNLLAQVQNDLFVVGSDLATPQEAVQSGDNPTRLPEGAHSFMEDAIDTMESQLTPLTQFILPGGSPAAAALHVSRTICRRAERVIVAIHLLEEINSSVLKYVNRFSDMLFVMARFQNFKDGIPDTPWKKS